MSWSQLEPFLRLYNWSRTSRFNLCILDVRLPDGTGIRIMSAAASVTARCSDSLLLGIRETIRTRKKHFQYAEMPT